MRQDDDPGCPVGVPPAREGNILGATSQKPTATIRTRIPLPLNSTARETRGATLTTFRGLCDDKEHVALTFLSQDGEVPLVRIHSECLTGDVFHSARCDCGPQLNESLQLLARTGGIILYLRQEGRAIGLYNKIDAYALQDQGFDTYEANCALNLPADGRDYTPAAQMLTALGVDMIKLISNNPAKRTQLEAAGVVVADVVPTGVFRTSANERYLSAKAAKANHQIAIQ